MEGVTVYLKAEHFVGILKYESIFSPPLILPFSYTSNWACGEVGSSYSFKTDFIGVAPVYTRSQFSINMPVEYIGNNSRLFKRTLCITKFPVRGFTLTKFHCTYLVAFCV